MIPDTYTFATGGKSKKKSHQKSRNGCASCKSRRVKCDEIHPSCSNCFRRGEVCEYIAPGPIFKKRKKKKPLSYSVDPDLELPDVSHKFSKPSPVTYGILKTPLMELDPFVDPSLTGFKEDLQGESFDSQEQDVRALMLRSLAPEKVLPTYMSFTILNSKMLDYYESNFIKRISNIPLVLQSWVALAAKVNRYPYVLHITMAVVLAFLFHDADAKSESGEREPVLSLSSPLMYKKLAALHYEQFLKCFNLKNIDKARDMTELFTYMATSTLNVLHHILSPCATVFDASFYRIARESSIIYKEYIPFVEIGEKTENDFLHTDTFYEKAVIPETPFYLRAPKSIAQSRNLDLSYYSSFSTPVVAQSPWLFFPSYLYQITEQQYFEDDQTYRQMKVDPEIIKHSIDILRKEYSLVYNNQQPERDALRILLRWPALVPEKFFMLVEKQDFRCMIVVAHFMMLLLSLDFDKLIPRRKLTGELVNLTAVLDEKWIPWIDLPRRCVGLL